MNDFERIGRTLERIADLLGVIAHSISWVTVWLFIIAMNSCRPH